jgi:hypothetical protein
MEINNTYIHCFDKLDREIFEGDFLDVQTDTVVREVYKKTDGQLYFTPYDKEDRVSAYFKIDMTKIGLL